MKKILLIPLILLLAHGPLAWSHCDSLGGPVVQDARRSLETGRPEPALKWIPVQREPEVRAAFDQAYKARKKNPKQSAKTDLSFFETVVRIHREHEGMPYEGLQPEEKVPLALMLADKALNEGSSKELYDELDRAIRRRAEILFQEAIKMKPEADQNPEKGRHYVKSYTQFIHYIETLNETIEGASAHSAAISKGIEACREDIGRFCEEIKPGNARLANCLHPKLKELSESCRKFAGHGGPGHEFESLTDLDKTLQN